ncbi:bifunctional phosphoribosylaminoimidazolecarboxamide formyltransferase/IMP cyclohydrolase [Candidatus Peribacteria bacterium RIFCSPHIGHO2_02_FULL_51_15]|nr:MAG: bifunctional phosphoribosylaminoimidazolecarboxamide formyltransferase/IMP cyclohydrolase [Candidatus Peribacteria bacterium RIFCSPHIGHO2_02_FULL_51_15]
MPRSSSSPHRRALISVFDKTGIVDFAASLQAAGFQIISTGGTQRALEEAGITVLNVEKLTQFPECFGGRLKTIHPLVAGGILYKRDEEEQVAEAKELGIEPVDVVVVNLYPFAETVEKSGFKPAPGAALPEEVIEQIDIGGPMLLRSAAKNHHTVTVICDPSDYAEVASQIKEKGDTAVEFRRELAAKVFAHTSAYDSLIGEYLSGGKTAGVMLDNRRTLRYGENPHQTGVFFDVMAHVTLNQESSNKPKAKSQKPKASQWKQLQGKDLSYLNILDADAAWRMAMDFSPPTAVFVKHANPCGIASHEKIEEAFQRGYDTDRLSAFGVIIAINRNCSAEIAKKIIDQKIFTEVILAPSFEPGALELLRQKPNIRVLYMDGTVFSGEPVYRSAFGGMLVQDEDTKQVTAGDLVCVTEKKPTPKQTDDLLFAWKVVKHAKSNAIVLAKDQVSIGIGCGQTSRVDSTHIALRRAGDRVKGSALASDAFFPFPDSIEEAAKHSISAVIHPGGSIRDKEVFARADELGLVMVVTGIRGFRH